MKLFLKKEVVEKSAPTFRQVDPLQVDHFGRVKHLVLQFDESVPR